MSTTPEAALRWNNKPTNKDDLRKWGNEFRFSSLTKKLSGTDNGLATWASYLHQTAIDFGAHPNRDALYSNMKIDELEDGSVSVNMVYLHPWDALSVSTTKFAIETGMIAVRLYALGFPGAAQTLRIEQDMNRMVATLVHLQETTKIRGLP